MRTILFFDLQSFFKTKKTWLALAVVVTFGIFAGSKARFTLADALCYNGTYQVAFITGFLSLTALFFGTLFTAQASLKEIEHRFQLIYFALPINRSKFLWARFLSVFIVSFSFTLLLTSSFFIGREFLATDWKDAGFHLSYYIQPMLLFTFVNTFFVVAVTTSVAWWSQSKMMIYVSGLLLYVLYMVTMVFSGSPFMANQLPQSKAVQFWSGVFDPFGLSSFFNQTSSWSIQQKNVDYLNIFGMVSINRIGVVLISIGLLAVASKRFQLFSKVKKAKGLAITQEIKTLPFQFVVPQFTAVSQWQSFVSFTRINTKYALKSIPFLLIVLGILFAVGMEMYAEIEKGIRLPQKYATSGLLVSTIIQNFYPLGVCIMVFYANDLYWRSQVNRFHFMETTTANSQWRFWSLWFTLAILAVLLSIILIVQGVLFQILYQYAFFDWTVYAKVLYLVTLPLLVLGALSLLFQKILPNKYIALAVSGVVALVLTTSLGKVFIKHPLLKFLHTIPFDYSDMNGFGSYENVVVTRLFFGFVVVLVLMMVFVQYSVTSRKKIVLVSIAMFLILGIGLGISLVADYEPKNDKEIIAQKVNYEKQFRRFQNKPQPIITQVVTTVDLFPKENRYIIKGNYVMENKSQEAISEVLIGFPDDFKVIKAVVKNANTSIAIHQQNQAVRLPEVLHSKANLTLEFELTYQLRPVKGHQSFNAIIENGSFMRISRYYPQIGYDSGMEVEDKRLRQQNNLGKPTAILSLSAPRTLHNDLIDLDMTVTTASDQTAIGVGELVEFRKESQRNVFQFQARQIPFRFAISSARYAVKKEVYKGKRFEVYYHPSHYENVAHLIKNAKITMDYCETNFGVYPYKTIRFAEISSFTQGFNATAYPASIYMTENMAFHCNLKADNQQDVINELAGHELAHLWWGNAQINPDDREGAPMLTETLAMYTELMLLKKMHGKKRVEEVVAMHQDIYTNERGFNGDVPLIKTSSETPHISYSKGAVTMYRLSEWIGEERVNLALRNFLAQCKKGTYKPVATDFLKEVYAVAGEKWRRKIRKGFER
ncbi:MAG: M1 family aminopeptidase [Limnohabitans sp.]|nr:M1 family aminopeptidase [Limnohabitans sp.]